MHSNISLCMIVRNEEENLRNCLESVKAVVDEIVIVDTGSTDSTLDVAAQFGARSLHHDWHNDFSEVRNYSLDSANGEWILVLDADEELTPRSAEVLSDILGSSTADGIEITVRSEMPDQDILKYEDTRIVRLFRNRREYRYVMPIHEQIRSSIEKNGGSIEKSDLLILHHGYSRKTVQGNEGRAERNLRILREALSRTPNDPYLQYQFGMTLMSTGRKVEAYDNLKHVLDLDYSGMGPVILERLFMKLSQLSLDRNKNEEAINYSQESLRYNPANVIAMYVRAAALLSSNRISEGYEILLKIRAAQDKALRLDDQLEQLISACERALRA